MACLNQWTEILYESGTIVGQYQFREHWSAEGCILCGGDFNLGSTIRI